MLRFMIKLPFRIIAAPVWLVLAAVNIVLVILCMFESCDTEEFTEILGKLLGGKQTSKVTAHLEALEELLTEEEYSSFLAEYLGYLTVNVAEFIRSTIIENGLMLLAGSGGEEDGEEDGEDGL